MRILTAGAAMALLVSGARLGAQDEPVAIKPNYVRPQMDSVADSSVARDSAAPRRIQPNCWQAQPRPACNGFFLTEMGIETPMRSTAVRDRRGTDGTLGPERDAATRIVWSFGFMGTSGSHSHGAMLSLTPDDRFSDPLPMTLEYRYRRWLGRASALDGAIGYREVGVWKDGVGYQVGRGATVMAGYTFNSYVGFSLRGDLIRAAGRQRRAVHVGLRSTRLSERFLKLTAVALARAALAAIGVEWDDCAGEEDCDG
jgi:hypothetical protein